MKRIRDLRPQGSRRFKAIVLPAVIAMMTVQIGCDPNDPELNGETGTTTSAIVGGTDTTIAQHPWQITIRVPGFNHWCGGSILNPDWILTAAHCVEQWSPSQVTVRAGITRLSQNNGQVIGVSEIIMFPGYVRPSSGKDVALLRLSSPLDLSGPGATAIGLVTEADEAAGLTDPGVDTLVTGWGALSSGGSGPNTLQVVEVPVISNAVADQAYKAADPSITVTDDQLAAGLFNIGGKDACQGDSGGPLTVVNGAGTRLLAGVVSWGFGCADPRFPGMYARVSSFVDWIDQNTSSEPPPPPPPPPSGSWSGSATPNLATVDNGEACTDLTVSDSGDAADVQLDISGNHDWRSILRGTLTHNGETVDAFPTGTFPRGGGSFSFTDRQVSGLSGSASGTWTLCIIDTDAFGDTGVLNSWSVHN